MNFAPVREMGWKIKKDLAWGLWRFKTYTKPTELKKPYSVVGFKNK